MTQRSLKKYKLDSRTAEDIEERVSELAKAYVPEWHFDREDPDIGSVITRIFARQMQDSIRAINHMTEIYHAEFVNFLDLTLKRAVPAGSIVVFNLVDSSVSGTHVPKGTRVIAEGTSEEEGTVSPVFETDRDLYVTASKISDIFMTDREEGTIVPLKGEFSAPELYKLNEEEKPAVSESTEDDDEEAAFKPFVLFNEDESIGRHVVAIMHPTVFDTEMNTIKIRIDGNEKLFSMIKKGELKFSYLSEEGIKEFDDMSVTNDGAFALKKSEPCLKIGPDEDSGDSIVFLESTHPLTEVFEVSDIFVSSKGDKIEPEYVGDGNGEFRKSEFSPFSDTLSMFAECYIGRDDYFDKAGSKVTLSFKLSVLEHQIDINKEQENEELKIIKRKARAVQEGTISEARCDEIGIEYFNGIGWKYLNCDTEYRYLFSGENNGSFSLSFICPSDWAETESGAYQGRMLRLRLMRADNAYLRPAIHYYPVLKDFKISYTYDETMMRPSGLKAISGTRLDDLTDVARRGDKFYLFTPIDYADDALYLGFDKQIENGPVGIMFALQGASGQRGVNCRYEYSSRKGFKQIKVSDGTEGFTHTGIIAFIPPADFYPITLEGKKRYWLRILREDAQSEDERKHFMTHIENIRINAAPVTNAVNTNEEDFYIDEADAGLKVFLGASNILDTEVWVNEKGSMSSEEMKNLYAEHPDDVKIETDMIGNVTSCFVKWHETNQFNEWSGNSIYGTAWNERRCYRIDRLTGEIIFGDGVHTDIPRVTDDVAFKVRLRTSNGADGNVGPYTITNMYDEMPFIDNVENPVKAYGGSNMETVGAALLRGADRINSRGRLVSMNDYKRAILRFSSMIDKVAAIPGLTIDGKESPMELSFALLMKDCIDGAYSFHRIEAPLKKYLLKHCEMTVEAPHLHITEPIFVEVSVTAWTEIMDMDDNFEVQSQIRDVLNDYLDPVSGGGEGGYGWEIGTIPKKTQILLQLSGLKNQALIRKISITARYTDKDGGHEIDYDDLVLNPFMVVKSGFHQVNILYNKDTEDA